MLVISPQNDDAGPNKRYREDDTATGVVAGELLGVFGMPSVPSVVRNVRLKSLPTTPPIPITPPIMLLDDAAEEGSRGKRKSLSPAKLKEALQLVQIHMAWCNVDNLS